MDPYENVIFFDRYQVERTLKESSFSVSLIGHDLASNRDVLIRLVNPIAITKYEIDKISYVKDMGVIRHFESPGILKMLDSGNYANTICSIYEYNNNTFLSEHLAKYGRLDTVTALKLIRQLAYALKYAHDQHIYHRNLSAECIALHESDMGELTAELFDFGLSYMIDYSTAAGKQVDEHFGYMAPEATGLLDTKIDGRSDLYSLGALLYQLITGTLPFHSDSIDNMVYQHVAVPVRPPHEMVSGLSNDASRITVKLLAKDPDQRYQTCNEVINDIDRLLSGNLESDILLSSTASIIKALESDSKYLCRRRELNEIKALVTKAFDKGGAFYLLRGPKNCGKSDLFSNLCSELVAASIPFFRCHFSQISTPVPYSGFVEILTDYLALFNKYDKKLQITEGRRLAGLLSGSTDTVLSFCPEMRAVLPKRTGGLDTETFKDQQHTLMQLAAFFLSLYTQKKPFVYIFDDIHNADPASLSLIEEIARSISSYKVFIICSYSNNLSSENDYLKNFLDRLIESGYSDFFDLFPYDEARLADFFKDLLSLGHDDSQALASYLLPKTEGNPYYAVNIIRSMIEDDVISIRNGRLEQNWQQLKSLNSVSDMQQIIERRINSLDEDTVTLLEIASVIGTEFSLDLISIVTDLKINELLRMFEVPLQCHLVEFSSSKNIMVFAHNDIFDAISSRIEKLRLESLHLWIAKAIELTIDSRPADIFSLCTHLKAARAYADLRVHIMTAARAALASNAVESAIGYYVTALRLLEDQGSEGNAEWKESKRSLVKLYLTSGRFDDAIAAANDLLALLRDNTQIAKLLFYIGLGYFRQSRFREAEDVLIRALDYLGHPMPKNTMTIKTSSLLLRLKKLLTGSTPKSLEEYKAPLMGDELESAVTIVSIYEVLCWIYVYSDMPRFDYVCLQLYKFTSKNFGATAEMATACSALSLYYMLHGDDTLSDSAQHLSIKLRRSNNDSFGISRSLFMSGLCKLCQGDIERSIKLFNEAIEGFTQVGDLWEINNTNSFLVLAYLYIGDYDKCEKLSIDVIEISKKIKDSLAQCQAYSALIRSHTHRGNYPKASEVSSRCEMLVGQMRLPYMTTLFNLTYGELLIEQCKYREAVKYLDAARIYYETNGFVREFTASLYGYLCIAKIKLLDTERGDLALNEIHSHELDIGSLCDKAMDQIDDRPNLVFAAYRANALYNIIQNKTEKTDYFYKKASALASDSGIRYESALIDYEYGCFLTSQHRNHEARYYTFEAYMTFSSLSSSVYLKQCEAIIAEKYQDDFKENSLIANVTARRNRMNIDRKVNTLLHLGSILTSTLELEELQKKILKDAVELVGAERGILFLYPESGEKRLYVASVYNLGNFDCNTYDWMLEEVEKNKRPIVINDMQSDEIRKHYTNMVRYGIKSAMAMPMFVRGVLFGVIYLDSRLVRQIFSEDYLETMEFIANQGGAPIENARLYHRAITDGLTGIYGRSYLDNLIMDRTSESSVELSALMIDVDFFKKFNDTYGHPFGDKVLKMIANVMKRVSGEHGTPCRYGGEEFVILLDTSNPESAMEIAEKLRQTVENSTIAFNNGVEVTMVSVTISIGVSIWNTSFERVDLIEHADKALYYAKQHGRNRSVLWTDDLQ
ncbi:MAG: diguanylate cyclase [Lachnospiraceae bacterium]|nr:diguanylate cyclase [Lachnospiraceae bacterium]